MTLTELNQLPSEILATELHKCCGSGNWVNKMISARPFSNDIALTTAAEEAWSSCTHQDALEAFSHHPKIGTREELAKRFGTTAHWAGDEQSGVKGANENILEALEKANQEYEKKFGYIFIVCATGKTAAEMLGILQQRLPHPPAEEIEVARAEQMKITLLRLNKLLAS